MTRRIMWLAVAGMALVASAAGAAVMVRWALDDLVRESEVIVLGRVTASTSFLEEGPGRINTRHTVLVKEYLKGDGPESITVVTMGGELEEVGQVVPGEARLAVGEEVMLCLAGVGSHFVVKGMAQGKFRLEPGKELPELVRELGGIHFVGEKKRPGPAPDRLTLDSFRELVRSIGR